MGIENMPQNYGEEGAPEEENISMDAMVEQEKEVEVADEKKPEDGFEGEKPEENKEKIFLDKNGREHKVGDVVRFGVGPRREVYAVGLTENYIIKNFGDKFVVVYKEGENPEETEEIIPIGDFNPLPSEEEIRKAKGV